jgi:arabinogalactan endo-1,4-beta-galactosidase
MKKIYSVNSRSDNMNIRIIVPIIFFIALVFFGFSCSKDHKNDESEVDEKVFYTTDQFCMGADLSYVNQILDHEGVYKDSGAIRDPYRIFKEYGTNLVRLRLWHNPLWTKEIYGEQGTQLYNDLYDVERSIAAAKSNGMAVLLDIHYSDTWADPAKQNPPSAWKNIQDLSVLKDSVYQYTSKLLTVLKSKSLFPEMIQIGNEINCGMMITQTETGFPLLNCCDDHWTELGEVLNAAIKAVRDASSDLSPKPLVMLHVADPKNVEWWFDNIINEGKVTDFDVVGFSYYPLWHTSISYDNLLSVISGFKTRYNRKVMILETAYPWTKDGADTYQNAFIDKDPLGSFAFTPEGQKAFLLDLTQKVISAGANGVIYWEPAWITSQTKDLWNTGSSWENCAFFDFSGNASPAMEYMTYSYKFPAK